MTGKLLNIIYIIFKWESVDMYELRKWIKKPTHKEVMYTNINDQALEETMAELVETYNIKDEKEFFELYEIEDLETGLKNEDVLVNI